MLTRVIVIPARFASSRLPGKPLVEIAGRSMIERVHRIASAALAEDPNPAMTPDTGSMVVVATDDQRIAEHVRGFGGLAVMTPSDCANGTERVRAALLELEREGSLVSDGEQQLIVNLQGDAVLTPPWVIQEVLRSLVSRPDIEVATPAVRLDWSGFDTLIEARARGEVGGTTVVFDRDQRALYFSKQPIPLVREREAECPAYRHIGLYGYRRSALERYLSLEATVLERSEGLEQLRALEHGMHVQVVVVDYRGRTHASVDNPQDVARVEAIIDREGELVGD